MTFPLIGVCQSLSCDRLFVTPMDCTHQAPLFVEFSRQKYCSGQPFFSPGDLPDPEMEPRSPTLQADSLWSEPLGKPFDQGQLTNYKAVSNEAHSLLCPRPVRKLLSGPDFLLNVLSQRLGWRWKGKNGQQASLALIHNLSSPNSFSSIKVLFDLYLPDLCVQFFGWGKSAESLKGTSQTPAQCFLEIKRKISFINDW